MESTTQQNFTKMLKFLELVGGLKHIKRTGWVMQGVSDCETITGHMYRMSMMTFLLDGQQQQQELDRIKCMELALVHDLAESIVGDITPFCGISPEEKKHREETAMLEIASLLDERGEHLLDLFNEYEAQETPESKFVKDTDRFDMILQAFEYEKRDKCPKKHQMFFDSTHNKINHPLIKGLVNELNVQRQQSMNDDKQLMSVMDREFTDGYSSKSLDNNSENIAVATAAVASTSTSTSTQTTTTTTTADNIQ